MKKIVFLVAALMAVFSGIAAVSAYEGHTVDIKVHVENAVGVLVNQIDLGTRFPQETVESDLTWGMTKSFFMQDRMSQISYRLFFELKPLAGHGPPTPAPAYLTNYFLPLNPFMELSSGAGDVTLELPAVYQVKPTTTTPTLIGNGTLYWTSTGNGEDLCDTLHLHTNIPVFEGYYNALTDAGVKPAVWTFGMLLDGIQGDPANEFVLVTETICGQPVKVPHADLGINLKIQVIGFTPHGGGRTDWSW